MYILRAGKGSLFIGKKIGREREGKWRRANKYIGQP